MGLDLGQSGDHGAAAIVERSLPPGPDAFGRPTHGPVDDRYRVVSLRRWPLGTPYTTLARDVALAPVHVLAVEYNGVGRPFVDFLRGEVARAAADSCQRPPAVICPILTASASATARQKHDIRGPRYVVPKTDMVTAIQLTLDERRLLLPDLPETRQLLEEVSRFRLRYTPRGNVTLGGEGEHDDLVIALGLAVWYARMVGYRRELALLAP